jgi:mono/diheme cytochrome c family protein
MRLPVLSVALALLGASACEPIVDTTEVRAEPQVVDDPAALSADLSFADHVFPLMERYCLDCHAGTGAAGGVDLSTHEDIMTSGTVVAGDSIASLLFAVVNGGAMPPPGSPSPSDVEVSILGAWIDAGALNN